MCMMNCRFKHSIVSLHLCKEYLTAIKLKTLFWLQIKYWTFSYMDNSSSVKSSTLENEWNSRNVWMVNCHFSVGRFLANVNSSSCSLYVIGRPSVCLSSVVCNVRAPYSGDWNFPQCFQAVWYLGHPWPFCKNFTKMVPGEPLRRGS